MRKDRVCFYFSFIIFLIVICLAIHEICTKPNTKAHGVVLKDGHTYQFNDKVSMFKSHPNIFHDAKQCEKCKKGNKDVAF